MSEDYSIKMTSTNEEMASPPKPKQSPLEFRNTDLVSRLLAATPPYLYNMPLVPHSYFFSEMLRSLVQGKTEAAARMQQNIPHRRSRKRTWSHGRSDHYAPKQMSPNMKCDTTEMPPPNWTPKLTEKPEIPIERPLELTMSKIPLNNNTKLCHTETQSNENRQEDGHKLSNQMINTEKVEMQHPAPPNGHVPLSFPPIPNLPPQDANNASSELILPPPPPIWYPPLYPTPYGIDPLHFFIDLRVSGHIYDRKNSKEHSNLNMNLPPHSVANHLPIGNSINHILDVNNSNAPSTMTSSSTSSLSESNFNMNRDSLVKQSRHASAFTVPTPSLAARNDPLNLSGNKYHSQQKIPRFGDEKPAKFDIKSMGFDTNPENSKSTNYILKNLTRIYKDVQNMKQDTEGIDLTSPKQEHDQKDEDVNVKDEVIDNKEEDKDGDKEKKCKDLRALIGLELVVDYVKHEKPGSKQSVSEESLTDIESNISSPAVEVVTIPDVENKMNNI